MNRTIEQIVEEKFDGSDIVWKVILKHLTPETIEFIKSDYIKSLKEERRSWLRYILGRATLILGSDLRATTARLQTDIDVAEMKLKALDENNNEKTN